MAEVLPLVEWRDEVYAVNLDKGWFERDRSWADTCALLLSEIFEMFEAYRDHGLKDASSKLTWNVKLAQSASEFTKNYVQHYHAQMQEVFTANEEFAPPVWNKMDEKATKLVLAEDGVLKPEGVGAELADVLIRWLDTAQRTGMDLNGFAQDALTTPGADFSHSIMTGVHYINNMWHGLQNGILAYDMRMLMGWILMMAKVCDLDLVYEYHRKIAYNRTRERLHGGKAL